MQSQATTPEQYLEELPEDRKAAIAKLRSIIKKKLPKGFKETMSYGMLGYVVPLTLYPAGYHCDPKLPLPFMCLASQKNFIALYHMGVYADPILFNWFTTAHEELGIGKLDMGKSCIRFKNMQKIPYDLLGELSSKITVADWIEMYEKNYVK